MGDDSDEDELEEDDDDADDDADEDLEGFDMNSLFEPDEPSAPSRSASFSEHGSWECKDATVTARCLR